MLQKVNKLLTWEIILVFIILIAAFLLRVYRVGEILAFHYDQGRDALVIWDLINSPHKLFLIGPTTGLAGLFRGPFYYYLIAPFYWLGGGNPTYPAVLLGALSSLALLFVYLIGRETGGKLTAFIALVLSAFSFEIIYASRWLSNPTPMLLLSVLLVWSLLRIYDGKKYYWVFLSLILGLSFFHFGSSGELFYFPAVLIFAVWMIFRQGFGKTQSTLNWRITIYSVLVFLITFSPLFIFNLKHDNILLKNVTGILGGEKSFALPYWQFVSDRLSQIGVYFSSLLFHSPSAKEWIHLSILFIIFIRLAPALYKNIKLRIIFLLIGSLAFGLLFFQGNGGVVYQYYLTGYYLIFLIFVAALLSFLFRSNLLGKTAAIYFMLYFILQNWMWVNPYLKTTGEESNVIVLSNQKLAIEWIYKNADARDFNIDSYVPPVISYSYDYLFKWMGNTRYQKTPNTNRVPLLYTLYEVDPDHKDRLEAWLARQKGIGTVIKEETFGGITVQERTRIIQ